jgi:hypothetical protein
MSLEFIQLQSYTAPSIIEQKNKDWVQYGDDNNYYQYLIDLYHGSPTNNACIKGIADQIYGKGLEVSSTSRNLPGYIEFKTMFAADDLRAVIMDLKMLGQASFQLVKSKDKKKYVKAKHFPQQTLRPAKCNDKGEIEKYYYYPDWANIKRGTQPTEIRAWGYDESSNECILTIKPYSTGSFYFAPVDYQGGTQYANLESEISNFHINNIMNGLAPSMLINFNNGQPPAEVKDTVEAQIKSKFGGSSNAGRFIISWNDGKDSAADITPVQLSDAHNQYQFLSSESMQKVMISHRVVSPLLLGIKDGTGFGNNADELKSASILFDNVVIRPFQRLVIDAVTKVLNHNGYNLNMYFKTLQPLEFTDLTGNVIDDETREEETGVSLSLKKKIDLAKVSFDYDDTLSTDRGKKLAQKLIDAGDDVYIISARGDKEGILATANELGIPESRVFATGSNKAKIDKVNELSISKHYDNNSDVVDALKGIGMQFEITDSQSEDWLKHLQTRGERINTDVWELIDVQEVTDADEELRFNMAYENPNKKSGDDKGVYKIRYRYGPNIVADNSRQFCSTMVQESKGGVIYRREDILTMGDAGVNGQFAPSGQSSYSIWKYKGGVNCHHRWERLTFRRKQIKGKFLPKQPGESGENRDLENYNEVSNKSANNAGVPFSPSGWETASTRPIDMPNKGSLKNK